MSYMAADVDRWNPQTRETADHSMPYVMSVALLRGQMLPEDLDGPVLRSTRIRQFMSKVKVRESAQYSAGDLHTSPARVTVQLSNGRSLAEEVLYPSGHAKSPLPEHAVEKKLKMLWPSSRGIVQAEDVLSALAQLPRAPTLEPLLRALAC